MIGAGSFSFPSFVGFVGFLSSVQAFWEGIRPRSGSGLWVSALSGIGWFGLINDTDGEDGLMGAHERFTMTLTEAFKRNICKDRRHSRICRGRQVSLPRNAGGLVMREIEIAEKIVSY